MQWGVNARNIANGRAFNHQLLFLLGFDCSECLHWECLVVSLLLPRFKGSSLSFFVLFLHRYGDLWYIKPTVIRHIAWLGKQRTVPSLSSNGSCINLIVALTSLCISFGLIYAFNFLESRLRLIGSIGFCIDWNISLRNASKRYIIYDQYERGHAAEYEGLHAVEKFWSTGTWKKPRSRATGLYLSCFDSFPDFRIPVL